jgi:hypothetical protein
LVLCGASGAAHFGHGFLGGLPVWAAFGFVVLVSSLVATGLVIGMSIGINRAQALMEHAMVCVERGEFARARGSVLFAARMDPRLKEVDEVKALYELIVSSERPCNAGQEIRRLYNAIPAERSAIRRFLKSPQFTVLVMVIFGLVLLVRLVNLFP